ncbi:MAG TPA: carnitine dehydratase [Alphaproteobacteria bacterium]|jgi:CoA:oxalate CoA-transferase|nr:carnitine dehydratase [Alphaproteobacteria bacterium]
MPLGAHMTPGALDGVRVIDFTGVIAGPYCTRLMADLGAEVIKVEPPIGDLLRMTFPRRKGRSTYFGQLNAGKKSICLDLKDPRAVELVLKLAEKSDVAVQNFRPGVMRGFGLGYEHMKARNPKIIYCNMSGFGQEGPSKDWAAFAPIIHAAAGLDMAMMSWQQDNTKPLNGSVPFADYMTGVHGNAAIVAALFRRERTGKGEEIDIAMTEVIYNALTNELQEAKMGAAGSRLLYRAIRAKDGLFVVNPLSPNNFADLCKSCGHPEWLEKYPLMTPERQQNWINLLNAVEEWAKDRTAAECEEIISAGGCPVGRLRRVEEALDEPQAQFRQSAVEIEDGAGSFTVANTPLRLCDSESRIREHVPFLGENNAEILCDVLGLKQGELTALIEEGVVQKERAAAQ